MAFKVLFALFCAFTVTLARDSSRIIGGSSAKLGQFPYQVGIITSTSNLCGGSILSKDLIITAAHCTSGLPQNGLTVFAGTLQVGQDAGIQSSSYVIHELYSPNGHDYDISIIRLSKSLTFSANVAPITLVGAGKTLAANTPAVVSGYGTTNLALDIAPQLLYVNVPIQSTETCSKYFRMTPRMICAGIVSGQQSSCQGDSGGPLVSGGQLVGIVSYGAGCGLAAPAVYVNVSNLREWIRAVTNI